MTYFSNDPAAFALLKIGNLLLLLPQIEVHAVEAVNIDPSEPAPGSVGWITYKQQRLPAYCLSEQLELLPQVLPQRRACVLLAGAGGYIGVLTDQVSATQLAAKRYALPATMVLPGTPLQYLAAHDGGVACGSDAQRLVAHISRLAGGGTA